MTKPKKCARCERALDGIYASVWNSKHGEVFYCHDDEDDCYGPATTQGYPELRREHND